MPINPSIAVSGRPANIGGLVMNFADKMNHQRQLDKQNTRADALFDMQKKQAATQAEAATRKRSIIDAANLALRIKKNPGRAREFLLQHRQGLIARQRNEPGVTTEHTDAQLRLAETDMDALLADNDGDLSVAYANKLLERDPETFNDILGPDGTPIGSRSNQSNRRFAGPNTPTPGRSAAAQQQEMNLLQTRGRIAASAAAQAATVDADRRHQAAMAVAAAKALPKQTDIAGQRKEFMKASGVWVKMRGAAEKLISTKATPAGDMSLVFAFMKLIDPSSTVREGEAASVVNAGNVPDYVRNTYNRVIKKEPLTPAQREDFKGQGREFLRLEGVRQIERESVFTGLAERAGFRPEDVVVDLLGKHRPKAPKPKATAAPTGGRRKVNVTGVTPGTPLTAAEQIEYDELKRKLAGLN